MGEGCQVSGGAHRALGGDERQDPPVEHLDEPLDDLGSDPGMALGQSPCPEQEHRSDHDVGKGVPDSCGVGADEVVLKGLGLVPPDMGGCQSPESGGDPVDDLARVDCRLDDVPGGPHAVGQVWARDHCDPVAGDGDHISPGQGVAVDDDGAHAHSRYILDSREGHNFRYRCLRK